MPEQQQHHNTGDDIDSTGQAFVVYVDERYDTPFRELVNYFRLGNRHALNTPVLPRLVWGSDGSYENLKIDNYEYTLDDLTLLIITIYELCVHSLKNDILFCDDLPAIMNEDGKLVDIINSGVNGYSFINEPENIHLHSEFIRSSAVRNIVTDGNLSNEFFGHNVEHMS